MKKVFLNPKTSILIGFLITLPFMFMEFATSSNLPRSNFPIQLFIFMWIIASIFLLLINSTLETIQGKNYQKKKNYLIITIKIIFGGILAYIWITIIIDQIPCFLGATGC